MGMDCYSLDKELKQLKEDVLQEMAKMRLMFAELYKYIAATEEVKSSKIKKGKKDANKRAMRKD